MKKSNKIWLLAGITFVTIGMAGMANYDSVTLLKNNVTSKVQAYNHNPNNILDNVYKDSTYGLILPFIFDKPGQTIEKDYLVSQFKKMGLTPNLSRDIISTGTTITVKENNNKYTIVVFGDTNGDGKVNLIDAQKIVLHHKYSDKALRGTYFIAGNVSNKDNVINLIDAQRVVMLQKGLTTKLLVNEPVSIKETDSQAPVITLKGVNPQRIKIGTPYNELGATVTDNLGKNVKVIINSSSVNINRIGTYTVTYNATDASGNKAKEVKRTVVVEDYVKDVKLTNPTKVNYKYGEKINLTGGKIIKTYASGKVETINVVESMISGYNANKLGSQTITVTYEGKKLTFTVVVEDYVKDVKLTNPTKVNYKYGEKINLTGGKIIKTYASGKVETINVVESMISGYNANKLGSQTITVTYEGKKFIFTVVVENYVKEIKIVTVPTKVKYMVGETLDLEGMKVNAIMADGGIEDITTKVTTNVTQANVDISEVIVSYTTNNTITGSNQTFEDIFAISVVKPISEIKVTENQKEGYCFDELNIAKLSSGNNEENLDKDKLQFEITKNGTIIADEKKAQVIPVQAQFDGTIDLKFIASETGVYTITVKMTGLDGSTIIAEKVINISIMDNTVVTGIQIEMVSQIKIGEQAKKIPIKFMHKYDNNEEVEINVEAKRLSLSGTGLEYELLDSREQRIETDESKTDARPYEPVKYISIKAKENAVEGQITMKIEVANAETNAYVKEMNVTIKKPVITLNINASDITLYSSNPGNIDNIKEDEYGDIYTLLPISLNVDGEIKKLTFGDIVIGKQEEGKVCITNISKYSIDLKAYDENKNEVVSNSAEIAYIGIAMTEGSEEDLRDGTMIISYGTSSVTLSINIQ